MISKNDLCHFWVFFLAFSDFSDSNSNHENYHLCNKASLPCQKMLKETFLKELNCYFCKKKFELQDFFVSFSWHWRSIKGLLREKLFSFYPINCLSGNFYQWELRRKHSCNDEAKSFSTEGNICNTNTFRSSPFVRTPTLGTKQEISFSNSRSITKLPIGILTVEIKSSFCESLEFEKELCGAKLGHLAIFLLAGDHQ